MLGAYYLNDPDSYVLEVMLPVSEGFALTRQLLSG